jgi:alkylation response protein AidB-like acyl-CoA dehydrogenase
VQLTFDADVEAFRADFVAFLDDHLPSEAEALERSRSSSHIPEWARRWQRLMFDNGWLLPGYPPEFGGRNATLLQQYVHQQELARRRSYLTFNPQGVGIISASLISFGTPEQQRRWAVPILRAEMTASLGMSEPGAGSDLASLRTRAMLDGDDFVVNGQKVWTSGAHDADVLLTFVRTDPDAPKHKGLTGFVVDMKAPGIEVRPLRQMTGGASFNEVFFTDVRVPDDHRLGDVNQGWTVALTTLMNERASIGGGGGGMGTLGSQRFIEMARNLGRANDSIARQRLADVYIHGAVARYTNMRAMARIKAGQLPGPEMSIAKLSLTLNFQRIANLVSLLLGPRLIADTGEWGTYAWAEFVLGVPGVRVAGGTDEVMRNIVGERVLGLPKEPRGDS